jgi:ABC-type branched-subunit amino acid transport system substrate-binding protein
VDEQNAKGGLLGKKIEMITEDNEGKPDVAARKAKKHILENKVDILAGGTASGTVLSASKVAAEYKKVFFNNGGLAESLTGKEFHRYQFRITSNTYSYASAMTQYLAIKPYRRYYIVCQDYVYGHDSAKGFKEQLKKYVPDATIVGEDYHPIANKDFGPYINKVIAAKADAVFSSNWGPDATNLIKQGRSLGLKAPFPFICSIVGTDPYLSNELKDDVVGVIGTNDYEMNVKTPENEAMIARYHAKYKDEKDFLLWWPSYPAGRGVIGWQYVFAAIEKAGSVDAEKIIETLENGFSYKTPVGVWTMRKCDHQVMLPMFVGQVKAGWNPWYNGSIRDDVKFPWTGDIMTIPAEKIAIPATPDYNPRCR